MANVAEILIKTQADVTAMTHLNGVLNALPPSAVEAAGGVNEALKRIITLEARNNVKALDTAIRGVISPAQVAASGVTSELAKINVIKPIAATDDLGKSISALPAKAIEAAAGVRGALDTIGTKFQDGLSTVADWAGNIIDWAKKAAIGIGLVTAALTVVGVEAVKSAADFATMTTQIANNTTMTTADIATMNTTIKQLASESGAPLDQLANGFMHAFNMMGNASDATTVLDIAMKSAVSTGSNVSTVTETLAKVMHQFSIPTADAAKTMDELHLASALGNTTLEEFTSSTAKAMVAAANLHVPLEDVLAGFVGLTRSGYDAADASTQISGILTHLVTPSAAARKEIEALSKSTGIDLVDDFTLAGLKAKGLTAIMQDIEHATRGNEDAILKLIPAQRGAIGALALTGNAAGDVVDAMNQLNAVINDGATPTAVAYARTTATLGFQWDVLKARFNLAKIALGDELMPVVMRALNWMMTEAPKAGAALSTIFNAFQTGGVGAGFGAIGDLLSGLLAKITSFLPPIKAKLAEWAHAFGDWITETAIPWLLGRLGDLAGRLFGWIGAQLPSIRDHLLAWGTALVDWVAPNVSKLLGNLLDLATRLLGWIGEQAPKLLAKLGTWGQNFVEWIKPYLGPMVEALGGALDKILNFIVDHLPEIRDHLLKWADEFVAWIAPQVPHILEELGKLALKLEGFLLESIPKIEALLGEWGKEFWKWISADVLPKLPGELGHILEMIGDWVLHHGIPDAVRLMEDLGTKIVQAIATGIKNHAGDVSNALGNLLHGLPVIGGIGDIIGGVTGGGGSTQTAGQNGVWYNGVFYPPGAQFNYHASGTMNAPGGLSWVGERGPELVNLLPGSQVFSADQSRQMANSGATVNVYVAGSVMTARGLATDVRTELLRMQRQGIDLGFN